MAPSLPNTGRIEAFSDGVFAIVITIMVLELKLPEHAAARGLWEGVLIPLLPRLVPYILSFLVIAIMWVNHHQLLHSAARATNAVLWCNIHLLFWMSLIPISTALLGDDPFSVVAVAIYGFVLAANSVAFTLLRWVTRDDRGNLHHAATVKKMAAGTCLYIASVPLAHVSIYISMAIFVIIPASFFLPDFLLPPWAREKR